MGREELTVTMSPSSNISGCEPEITARRVSTKATAEKAKGMAAVNRNPLLFRGVSMFKEDPDGEKFEKADMVVKDSTLVQW